MTIPLVSAPISAPFSFLLSPISHHRTLHLPHILRTSIEIPTLLARNGHFQSSADTFPHQPETHLPSPSSTCGCFAICQNFQNDVFVRGVSQQLGTTAVGTRPFLDVLESRGVSKIVFSRMECRKRTREDGCEDVRPEFLILTFLRPPSHETRVFDN